MDLAERGAASERSSHSSPPHVSCRTQRLATRVFRLRRCEYLWTSREVCLSASLTGLNTWGACECESTLGRCMARRACRPTALLPLYSPSLGTAAQSISWTLRSILPPYCFGPLDSGSDEMIGVMSKAEALAAAEERELDLVLIADKSDPPVRPEHSGAGTPL